MRTLLLLIKDSGILGSWRCAGYFLLNYFFDYSNLFSIYFCVRCIHIKIARTVLDFVHINGHQISSYALGAFLEKSASGLWFFVFNSLCLYIHSMAVLRRQTDTQRIVSCKYHRWLLVFYFRFDLDSLLASCLWISFMKSPNQLMGVSWSNPNL